MILFITLNETFCTQHIEIWCVRAAEDSVDFFLRRREGPELKCVHIIICIEYVRLRVCGGSSSGSVRDSLDSTAPAIRQPPASADPEKRPSLPFLCALVHMQTAQTQLSLRQLLPQIRPEPLPEAMPKPSFTP
jgi:hypothetical protein